jgi:hypothetical protein
VANGAHCPRNLKGKKEKGGRGGNRLKGWMLAVPRCSGGIGSEHFWIDGQPLRAAPKAPQRRRPCRSRAVLVDPSSFALVNRWYWCLGVIHERDLSIKQDKERAESTSGP